MRILLIEDDLGCAESFACLMDACVPDAEVTHCTTLQGALCALAFHGPFAVIVLDLSLPDAKGTEGLRRLTTFLGDTAETPIVVYTAYPQYQQACLEEGAAAFCIKATIDGADLAALLERIATDR